MCGAEHMRCRDRDHIASQAEVLFRHGVPVFTLLSLPDNTLFCFLVISFLSDTALPSLFPKGPELLETHDSFCCPPL